jgi:NADH-quinone oxidoreductase subunit J
MTLTAHDVLFYVFALLTVVPAFLAMVFAKNIVRAAFLLMLTFWGVAGLYGTLAADFLMVTQLVVYVGGILVLILFGVMLSRRMTMAELPVGGGAVLLGFLGGGALFLLLLRVIRETPWRVNQTIATTPTLRSPLEGETHFPIGDLFLGKFLLPFEFISLLLLGALIGAVILARKEIDPVSENER